MPRTARASVGGICYHAMNRGNGGQEVFHAPGDYEAFVRLLGEACERLPLRLLAYCIMPTHFHLVLWPHEDGDLSAWMQWLLTAHVRRYHRHKGTSGHVWQGRFKAFPIQRDEHLLTVLRYVERNALRAGLMKRAEDWPWSSLAALGGTEPVTWLHPSPVERWEGWREWVNEPQNEKEVETLRKCIARGAPYGSERWQKMTARKLGLESSIRPRGRPRSLTKK